VRRLFSDLFRLIALNGQTSDDLEFPFNSLVLANGTGVYQYLCQQAYPSYFIYPDMFGEPEKLKSRWVIYPNHKKLIVVENTHLTTTHQNSYLKN
jgi:hypothetical protein